MTDFIDQAITAGGGDDELSGDDIERKIACLIVEVCARGYGETGQVRFLDRMHDLILKLKSNKMKKTNEPIESADAE